MHTHTNALNMHYLYPNFLVQTQCGDSDSSELDSSCFEPDSVLEAEPRFKKFKYLSSVVSDKLKQQAIHHVDLLLVTQYRRNSWMPT